MSVSVIIPSYNEQEWLDRTIENILSTATRDIEVIVVLNGNWHPVDFRARVIRNPENQGERVAMNMAAAIAKHTHLLRIDAHCDFSPVGWDQMMEEVTGPRDMTQAVLTAVDKSWKRIPGHRYERCRLLPNYEAKWEKPNEDKGPGFIGESADPLIFTIPNMSSTGCGFMIRKDFYNEIGGADESYPCMGAIGEEFSVKTWLNGGKVQTRTDVIIGHIFATKDAVGYDTGGVLEARRKLVEQFGHRYGEIFERFPDLDWSEDLRPTAVRSDEHRDSVTVRRTDTETFRDGERKVVGMKIRVFAYLWVASDHPDEVDWSFEQLTAKYSSKAKVLESEQTLVANDRGRLVEQIMGGYVGTPEQHEIPSNEPETAPST